MSDAWKAAVDQEAKRHKPEIMLGGITSLDEQDDNDEEQEYFQECGDDHDLPDWFDDKLNLDDLKVVEGINKMFQFELGEPVLRVQAHGKKIIKARWVVARRDFKRRSPDQDGLFTPSSHPRSGFIIDCYAAKTGKSTRIADATNAYWHVPEIEEVYAIAREEMKSQRKEQILEYDIVLLLKKKRYGKRDA
eukprot:838370-Amphidinium_carterae.4